MTLVVTHATVTGAVADPTAIIDGPTWDANHTLTGVVSPVQGGTGVANDAASTITITGSFGITFTVSAATSLTLPTSGTVATTSNKLSAFAATTSAELAGVISDETGSGALVFANTPTLVTPLLGTPTSGTLTNCTGLPVATGISNLGAGIATFLTTPSSANLRSALTDESGTGAAYFQGGDLGTPSAGVLTNATGTAASLTAGTATNAVNSGVTDTSTNATYFPAFMSAATGNLPVRVTSGRWAFNPSWGSMSIGHATPSADGLLSVGGTLSSVATQQYAMIFAPTFSTSATSNGVGIYCAPNTAAGSYTQTSFQQIYLDNGSKGAGSTITNQYMLFIAAPTLGTNKYAIYSGGGNVAFLGNLGVGVDGLGNAAGSIAATNFIKSSSPTAGVGYSAGAGGTQTQITSKATGVTLNTICGAVTTHNASLAAATIVSFVLTNSAIAATDVLVLNHISGGTMGSYTLNARAAAGSATIDIRNNTAGALGEAMVIQFAVIKGVNS